MRPARTLVDAAIATAMTSRRWRPVGGCWLRELTGEVDAWVGVGLSARGHDIDADPMVGVRHEAVERLADPNKPSSATLLRPLYAVVGDERTYRTWSFTSDNVTDQADSLVELIESQAVPVLRALTTLEEIEAALREWSFADVRRRKLPAVLILRDRPDEARAVVQTELDDLRATSDPTTVEEYEQAAARLFNDQRDA